MPSRRPREAADVDLDPSRGQPEVHGPLDGAVAREGPGVERLAVAPGAGRRVVDGIARARRRPDRPRRPPRPCRCGPRRPAPRARCGTPCPAPCLVTTTRATSPATGGGTVTTGGGPGSMGVSDTSGVGAGPGENQPVAPRRPAVRCSCTRRPRPQGPRRAARRAPPPDSQRHAASCADSRSPPGQVGMALTPTSKEQT